MASKRAKHLVHASLRRADRVSLRDDDHSRHVAVSKSEFTRQLTQCRINGTPIYLDSYGRCYVPVPERWLHELDVKNDPDVQQLGLQVMFVDNEAGRSSSVLVASERRMLLYPGESVDLNIVVTKRSAARSIPLEDREKEMRVFALLGHARSRCFIVYLQDANA